MAACHYKSDNSLYIINSLKSREFISTGRHCVSCCHSGQILIVGIHCVCAYDGYNVSSIGTFGEDLNTTCNINIVCNNRGQILVYNNEKHSVEIFTNTWEFVTKFDTEAHLDNTRPRDIRRRGVSLNYPGRACFQVDNEDNIYVGGTHDNTVAKYDINGTSLNHFTISHSEFLISNNLLYSYNLKQDGYNEIVVYNNNGTQMASIDLSAVKCSNGTIDDIAISRDGRIILLIRDYNHLSLMALTKSQAKIYVLSGEGGLLHSFHYNTAPRCQMSLLQDNTLVISNSVNIDFVRLPGVWPPLSSTSEHLVQPLKVLCSHTIGNRVKQGHVSKLPLPNKLKTVIKGYAYSLA